MAYDTLGEVVERVHRLLPRRTALSDEQREDLEFTLHRLDEAAMTLRASLSLPPVKESKPGYGVRASLFPHITAKGIRVDVDTKPRGRGEERVKPRGASALSLLATTATLLNYYQSTDLADEHNDRALAHLDAARDELERRRLDRAERDVWGTDQR